MTINPLKQEENNNYFESKLIQNNSKHRTIKAKGTEDLKPYRPIIRFGDDMDVSPKLVSAFQAVRQRSGYIWECVNRTSNKNRQGYIYTLKARIPYCNSNILASNNENAAFTNQTIFPAVETSVNSAIRYSLCTKREKTKNNILSIVKRNASAIGTTLTPKQIEDYKNKIDQLLSNSPINALLAKLGIYCSIAEKGIYFHFPDIDALQFNWEKLQNKHPDLHLPPLNIITSEGIADDLSFILAFLSHDCLISSGIEFAHDCFLHLIPTLTLILQPINPTPDNQIEQQTFKSGRSKLSKMVMGALKKIWKAREKIGQIELGKLISGLGALADTFSTHAKHDQIRNSYQSSIGAMMKNIWSLDLWPIYFKKRFPNDNISSAHMDKIWKEVETFKKA